MIEHIGTPEPLIIAVVVHLIDDPRRREDLGTFSCALRLLRCRLVYSRLNVAGIKPQQHALSHLRIISVSGTVASITVRCEQYIFPCGLILQQTHYKPSDRISIQFYQFFQRNTPHLAKPGVMPAYLINAVLYYVKYLGRR